MPKFYNREERGANKWRKQIAVKVMTRTWSEKLKTALAGSESMIRKVLSNIITAA